MAASCDGLASHPILSGCDSRSSSSTVCSRRRASAFSSPAASRSASSTPATGSARRRPHARPSRASASCGTSASCRPTRPCSCATPRCPSCISSASNHASGSVLRPALMPSIRSWLGTSLRLAARARTASRCGSARPARWIAHLGVVRHPVGAVVAAVIEPCGVVVETVAGALVVVHDVMRPRHDLEAPDGHRVIHADVPGRVDRQGRGGHRPRRCGPRARPRRSPCPRTRPGWPPRSAVVFLLDQRVADSSP